MEERLKLALELVQKAEEIVMPYYNDGCDVESKSCGTFVTQADRNAEIALRAMIKERFPEDGIIGEEFPGEDTEGEYTWTIDPIDGTSSFIHRVPLFGTIIGLVHNGQAVMGVIHFPALGETAYAIKGQGAHWRAAPGAQFRPCRVSQKNSLTKSTFSYSAIEYFKMGRRKFILEKMRKKMGMERVWGDCYGHFLVATGKIDVMVDPKLYIWDIVPVKILVEEAGGTFFGINGGRDIKIDSGISCNSELAEQFRKEVLELPN